MILTIVQREKLRDVADAQKKGRIHESAAADKSGDLSDGDKSGRTDPTFRPYRAYSAGFANVGDLRNSVRGE